MRLFHLVHKNNQIRIILHLSGEYAPAFRADYAARHAYEFIHRDRGVLVLAHVDPYHLLLFGDEKKMIRIDMSEYKDSSISVDKLIGMPRGIVGSERGGILTTQVKDNPYLVIFVDEVEKAHPYVLNLFLQVFDEGWLTDGRGKRVYFSDTVIIMTSNLGSDEFKKFTKTLGFIAEGEKQKVESLKKNIMKEVENTLSPEFINRIDDVCVFSPLTRQEVGKIAVMHL